MPSNETNLTVFLIAPTKWFTFCRAALFPFENAPLIIAESSLLVGVLRGGFPGPVVDFGHVNAVFVDVFAVFDQFALHLFL